MFLFCSLDDIMKVKKNIKEVIIPDSLSSSVVIVTSTITSTSTPMTSQVSSTEAIQPTSTLVANVDRLITIYQPQTSTPRSSSLSSSRPHSVSVTTVSHTERLPTTSVAATIERPSMKTTKPASKTYENSATSAGQHGTMKLFRFILSFHIIHEGMLCTCTRKNTSLHLSIPAHAKVFTQVCKLCCAPITEFFTFTKVSIGCS